MPPEGVIWHLPDKVVRRLSLIASYETSKQFSDHRSVLVFTRVGECTGSFRNVRSSSAMGGKAVRSANLGRIGTFQTDGHEGSTIRSFKDKYTGLVITVGINHVFEYSTRPQKPFEIRLAITAGAEEVKKIFESIDSAEASTRYDKKWNLTVTKNVKFEDVTYMFTLRCWDNTSR